MNTTKRGKADEDSVWSWWVTHFSIILRGLLIHVLAYVINELHTDMIAETRRKLDRRALKQPQVRNLFHL